MYIRIHVYTYVLIAHPRTHNTPLGRSRTQTCPSSAASAAPPAEPARSATTNATQGTHTHTHTYTRVQINKSALQRVQKLAHTQHETRANRGRAGRGCASRKMCCSEMRCVITTWSIASPSSGAGRRAAAAPDIAEAKSSRATAAFRIVALRGGTAACSLTVRPGNSFNEEVHV
jgi:hypothetical protein